MVVKAAPSTPRQRSSLSMSDLVLTIVGIVAGVVGSFIPQPAGGAIAVLAAGVSCVGALRMYKAAQPYVHEFDDTSWNRVSERSWELVIPWRIHKKASP